MNRLNPNLLYEITSNYLCGKYFSSIPKIAVIFTIFLSTCAYIIFQLMNRDFYHAFLAHFRHIRILYLVEEEKGKTISFTKRFPANESGDFVIINTIDLIREQQNLAQLNTFDQLYPSYNLHTTFAVFNFLLKLRCIQTIDTLSLNRGYRFSYKDYYSRFGYKDYYARGREDTNMHNLIQHLHDAGKFSKMKQLIQRRNSVQGRSKCRIQDFSWGYRITKRSRT